MALQNPILSMKSLLGELTSKTTVILFRWSYGLAAMGAECGVREQLDTAGLAMHRLLIQAPYRTFLPQRFAAALAAICERVFGDNAAALAAPPFNPPNRPNATAAGFLGFSSGVNFSAWPVDSSMI
jgi:hypothetical protein